MRFFITLGLILVFAHTPSAQVASDQALALVLLENGYVLEIALQFDYDAYLGNGLFSVGNHTV